MSRLDAVSLEGTWVRLEPLTRAHFDALWDAVDGAQLDVWRWLGTRVANRDDFDRYHEERLAARNSGDALPLCTMARADTRAPGARADNGSAPVWIPVGSSSLGAFVPEHARVEIGWTWIAPRWQRSAVNSETKLLMLRHAFETLELDRVELKTDSRNDRSRKAILRLGATEEGSLRHHMRTQHGPRDTVYYSILRDEWPEVEARLIARLERG